MEEFLQVCLWNWLTRDQLQPNCLPLHILLDYLQSFSRSCSWRFLLHILDQANLLTKMWFSLPAYSNMIFPWVQGRKIPHYRNDYKPLYYDINESCELMRLVACLLQIFENRHKHDNSYILCIERSSDTRLLDFQDLKLYNWLCEIIQRIGSSNCRAATILILHHLWWTFPASYNPNRTNYWKFPEAQRHLRL